MDDLMRTYEDIAQECAKEGHVGEWIYLYDSDEYKVYNRTCCRCGLLESRVIDAEVVRINGSTIRVYELAIELGVESRTILNIFGENFELRCASSRLLPAQADQIRDYYRNYQRYVIELASSPRLAYTLDSYEEMQDKLRELTERFPNDHYLVYRDYQREEK